MDNAVALVRAYLHVNGYFTVCEYPVLEASRHGGYRAVTDLDVLAFRFPNAGRLVAGLPETAPASFQPDPRLDVPADVPDMLIGEVKEGRARLNEATTDPAVLETALVRFGCCAPEEAPALVRRVRRDGTATGPHGHRVRLLVFASRPEAVPQAGVRVLPLGHVIHFLQAYLDQYWDVLHHAQFKDPAFGFLVTLQKALRHPQTPTENTNASNAHENQP
ncbi:hypothetical protein GQ464_012820 [Rhodocaloribacter litoris]|uniref:hypothetical protein n=1 Tax=Rhodocaloribacter litoris TaxID=2558931 RepID=UPI00141F0F5E|nr:hypothetical protein [Rhodocaloribacter litoris]QXD14317.1 hypothetical protein GQ464_012820 [Rhodocaloribacter litoris]GIV80385.1 MAG: hypothetical protein KatS3mg050_4779 [Litorilinea sp.]